MSKKYKFEVNLSSPANFEVTRALGEPHSTTGYTDAQLQRFADYIKYIVDKGLAEPNRPIKVSFYAGGGGTELILSQATKFAGYAKDYVDIIACSLPVRDVYEHREELFALARLLGDKLLVNTHYDFGMDVDPAVEIDTPGTPRYNLRWLFARGLGTYVSAFATTQNIGNFMAVFDDFLTLRKSVPNLKCDVVVDPIEDAGAAPIDEATARAALSAIAAYLETHPELQGAFNYRMTHAVREDRKPDALMSNVVAVMAEGGVIYPGYDVPFMTAKALDDFPLGIIEDDFDLLENRRAELIAQLPESSETLDGGCNDMLRSVPWVDEDGEWSLTPSDNLCILHSLLAEYLPRRDGASNVA